MSESRRQRRKLQRMMKKAYDKQMRDVWKRAKEQKKDEDSE